MFQTDLARAAGISRSQLAKIEAGFCDPTLGDLTKIASALRVSVKELIP